MYHAPYPQAVGNILGLQLQPYSTHTLLFWYSYVSSPLFLSISDSLGLPTSLQGQYFKIVSFSKLYLRFNISFIHSFIINWIPTCPHLLDLENMTVNKIGKNSSPQGTCHSAGTFKKIFLAFHFCLSRCLSMTPLTSPSQKDFDVLINHYLMCGAPLFSSLWLGGPTSSHLLTGINVTGRPFEDPWISQYKS